MLADGWIVYGGFPKEGVRRPVEVLRRLVRSIAISSCRAERIVHFCRDLEKRNVTTASRRGCGSRKLAATRIGRVCRT